MLVSVVMATLNGMPYIQEALDSARKQTLNDIEILVVDSGSTDGLVEYVKECQREDPRIKFIHSDVKSTGYQYNLGIKHAQGEYVAFLDQDDILEEDGLQSLYNMACTQGKPDCVKADYNLFFDRDGERIFAQHNILHCSFQHLYGKTTKMFLHVYESDVGVFAGIYNREFLINNGITANESKGAMAQDIGLIFQIYLFADKIGYLKMPVHNYRRDNVSSGTNTTPDTTRWFCIEIPYCLSIFERYTGEKLSFVGIMFYRLINGLYYELGKSIFNNPSVAYKDELEKLQATIKDFYNKLPLNQQIVLMANDKMRIFLHSVEAFTQSAVIYQKEFVHKYYVLLKLLEQKRDVVIFGKGMNGKNLYVFLRNNGYNGNITFCANSAKTERQPVFDTYCDSVEETVMNHPDAVYLISSEQYEEEMREQLHSLSVKEENILLLGPTGEFLATDRPIYSNYKGLVKALNNEFSKSNP